MTFLFSWFGFGSSTQNVAPVAGSDCVTATEDKPITISASALLHNDYDKNGDRLTITSVQHATNGTVALVNGSIVFTPAPNYTGHATFSYTISDGKGGTSAATVTVDVCPVNDHPDAINDTVTITKAGAATIAASTLLANDRDVDGNILCITSVQNATNGTVALVGGNVVFTPAAGFSGTASFNYTISDGKGGHDTATVSVVVPKFNATPDAINDDVTAANNGAVTIAANTLLANDKDADGDTLTITSVQNASNGTVALVGGNVVYTPAAGFSGVATFTYTISDGKGGHDTATVCVTVPKGNTAPDAIDDHITGNEDTPLVINASTLLHNDKDADGNPLTITSVQAPVNGTVSLNGNQITFTPNANYNGPASFTYTISDGKGGTDTAKVNLDICPVNDHPDAINDGVITGNEDTQIIIPRTTLLANDKDVDGDVLTITSVQGAVNGTVALSGSNVVFTPNANYNGPASFTYTISDGKGGHDTATVNLNIQPVNDHPDAINDDVTAANNGAVTIAANTLLANDKDADGDTLTITSVQNASNGTVALVGGNVVYTPAAGFSGVATFTYTISDGKGGHDTATVCVTVPKGNTAPDAIDDHITGNEDTPLVINASTLLHNDKDADGNPLTITSVQAPVNGTVSLNGNQITFTPNANYNGPASFTYTISDGKGGTDTAKVNLDICPVNDHPDAIDDSVTAVNSAPMTILANTLLANDKDIDGDTITIKSVQSATNGNVALVNGNVVFTPAAGFSGTATFTYTVQDGKGGFDTATVSVIVPITPPPAIGTIYYSDSHGNVGKLNPTTGSNNVIGNAGKVFLDIAETPTGKLFGVTSEGGIAKLYSINPQTAAATFISSIGSTFVNALTADSSENLYAVNGSGHLLRISPTGDVTTLGAIGQSEGDLLVIGNNVYLSRVDNVLVKYDLATNQTSTAANLPEGIFGLAQNPNGNIYAIANDGKVYDVNPSTGAVSYTGADVNITGDIFGTATAPISQSPTNLPPDAIDDGIINVDVNTSIKIPVNSLLNNDLDPEGKPLTVISVQDAVNGTVSLSNGIVTFIPNSGYTGPATFKYTISDGTVAPAPAINIQLNFENLSVGQNIALQDGWTTNNAAGFVEINQGNVYGTNNHTKVIELERNSGDVSNLVREFNAAKGQVITLNFDYAARHGFTSGTDSAIQVLVNGQVLKTVNTQDVCFTKQTVTFEGNGGLMRLEFKALNSNSVGGLLDNISITAPAVQGVQGLTDTATVTLNILPPANSAPVDGNETNTVTEDATLSVSAAAGLLANASDADNNTLSITSYLVAGNPVPFTVSAGSPGVANIDGVGILSINANGSYSFAPAANYTGAIPVVTYTVSDGVGGTDTSTLTLSISPVNDGPVLDLDGSALGTGYLVSYAEGAAGIPIADTDISISDVDDTNIESAVIALQLPEAGDTLTVGTLPTGITLQSNVNGVITLVGSATLAQYQQAIRAITYSNNENTLVTGEREILITVNDGNLNSNTASTTILVSAVNDAPIAVSDNYSVVEDGAAIILTPLTGDSDPDGTTPTIQSINGTVLTPGVAQAVPVTGGIVNVSALGVITFTPEANFNGTITFPYVISDGALTATANQIITVIAANDGPTANDDTIDGTEDTPLVITAASLLGNDTDPESDPLSIISVQDAVNGTVSLDPVTGAVTFTPAANYNGPASFTYSISDGKGGVDTANVNLAIAAINDGPTANDDTIDGTEDTPLVITAASLLGNDTDPENDPLSIISVQDAVNGTVSLDPVTGAVTFTPAANYNGPASFTYSISDGKGGVDTAIVNLAIAAINDGPTANDDTIDGTEDTPLVITAASLLGNDTDPESDPLSIISVQDAVNGTVSLDPVTGAVTFTPAANYNGPASFTYSISDGKGGVDTAIVNLAIAAINDGPTANDDTIDGTEDTPLVITAASLLGNDTDPENDPLSIISVQDAVNGTVSLDPVTGAVTFTPAANYNGPASFTYSISDGKGGVDTANVNLAIAAINDGPTANDDTIDGTEDTPLVITAASLLGNDTDPENDPLSIISVQDAVNGTVSLDPVTGAVTFTPAANYNGPASFTYSISDGKGGVDTAIVNLAIAAINDGPTANDDTIDGTEDTPLVITAASLLGNDTDPESDPLSIISVQDAVNGTVSLDPVTGAVTFTPAANYNGPASFTYSISDGKGGVDTAIVNLAIAAINDGPTANDDTIDGTEDTPLVITAASLLGNDTDPENDPLSIISVQDAVNGTVSLDPVTGAVTFTPAANYNGPASFTYSISDGKGGVDTANVNLAIAAINDGPTANDDTIDGTEDTPLVITAASLLGNDTDPENDPLSIISVQDAVNGTVSLDPVTGAVTFTPAANYNGPASFTYSISDGKGGVDTANVNLAIAAINDGPTANDDTIDGTEDTPLVITAASLLGNDTDPESDPLSIISVQDAVNGTVSLDPVTGAVTFTPSANYNGPASFTYSISDGKGGVDTAIVNLTIAAINDVPTAVLDELVTEANNPIVVSVNDLLLNDTDPEGDTLTVTSVQGALNGTVSLDSVTGEVTFTPNNNYNGPASFTYTVSDGNGGFSTAIVNVDVEAPANTQPTANDDNIIARENSPVEILFGDLTSNDTDVDNDVLSLINVQNPINGSVSIDAITGKVIFVPAPNYTGPASFTYTISDGKGGESSAVVNLTIEPMANQEFTPSVSEEGLFGGSPDTLGVIDITNSAVFSGLFAFANPNGTVSVSLDAPTTILTVGGNPVSWVGSGTQTLTATILGNIPVAQLSINDSGNYTFNLLAPVDHPIKGLEDVINLNFGVALTDGAFVASKTLTINIEDDMPSVEPKVDEIIVVDTNLLITLDISGSMAQASGIDNQSRIESAVQSIKNLVDTYDTFGDVRVRLITFSSDAKAVGDKWLTVAELKEELANIELIGVTNYDAALGETIGAFDAVGKLDNAQAISYFFSDGDPNRGKGDISNLNGSINNNPIDRGIQADEEATWKEFLNVNQIKSFAIGIGTEITTPDLLNPIAYDGQAKTDLNAVIVTSFANLDQVLADTIVGTNRFGEFDLGADFGMLNSVTIEGVTYTYNPINNTVTLDNGINANDYDPFTTSLSVELSSGGKYIVNFTMAQYEYVLPPTVSAGFIETIGFIATDMDGDTVGATNALAINKTSVLAGTSGDDTFLPNGSPVIVYGEQGNDIIIGGDSLDRLFGDEGDDTLQGGQGSDILSGGAGADTFVWRLADLTGQGADVDVIVDFETTLNFEALNLSDLLQGETSTAESLDNYLHFDIAGNNTVISINANGEFADNNPTGFGPRLTHVDQQIILSGVDLIGSATTDAQVIQNLLTQQKLITD